MEQVAAFALLCGEEPLSNYLLSIDPSQINCQMKGRWATPLYHSYSRVFSSSTRDPKMYHELIEMLIGKGAIIGDPEMLRTSIINGDSAMFQRILDCKPSLLSVQQLTLALGLAAKHGQVEMARALMDHGANPNTQEGPLELAQDPVMIRLLGANPNTQEDPLELAQDPDMIRLLVSRGADISAALKCCSVEKLRLLAELSGDAPTLLNRILSPYGKTLLHYLLERFPFEELDEVSREVSLDEYAEDYAYNSINDSEEEFPYEEMIACEERRFHERQYLLGRREVIEELLRLGADPSLKSAGGETCWDLGARACALLVNFARPM